MLFMMISVYIKPGSKKDMMEWIDEDTIKVHVRAVPEKGKANDALIELLSKRLGIKKTDIEIVRGKTARIKHVRIQGLHLPLRETTDYSE